MINEPLITVTCDNGECGYTAEYEMTALAGGGWDDRYLKTKMQKDGWVLDGDLTYCDTCSEDRANVDANV
jgi:hypothetical protein